MQFEAVHVGWMQQALALAEVAAGQGEVPVGAILVKENEILASACNASIQQGDPTAHAEMLVLRQAALASRYHCLHGTTLYITLEPCLMCLGAIIQLQVQRVVFGAYDLNRKIGGSTLDLIQLTHVGWRPDIWGGVCHAESYRLLRNFFQRQRSRIPSSE